MTKVLSIVRLVPHPRNSQDNSEYCVQFFIPAVYEGWKNIGNLFIRGGVIDWVPNSIFKNEFPNIDVDYSDVLGSDKKEDPFLFARYKIRSYVDDVLKTNSAFNHVIPGVLREENFGDNPDFLSQ